LQLNKSSVALSLLATLALLFGGWFLYEKVQLEGPIRAQLEQMESASLVHLQIDREKILIDVDVKNPERFPQEYRQLLDKAKDMAGDREVLVTVGNTSQTMLEIWHKGQFAFTEAVELRKYSRIPELMDDWKAEFQLDAALALMDDENVYVYLKKGTEDFYTIVSRSEQNEVTADA
jgi:hypothetical protein